MNGIPQRELYWNINHTAKFLMYPLFLIALAIFAYGMYQRYQYWKIGQKASVKWDFGRFLKETFFQRRILNELYPGLMHFGIFWGFTVLFLTTLIVAIQADFGIKVFTGNVYLLFSFLADVGGVAAIIGILMAIIRRYIIKPDRLDNKPDDLISLLLILTILVTGYIVEGIRMAVAGDNWAAYSPFGNLVAQLFTGADEGTLRLWHVILWWGHMLLAFGFIAYIPYSKLIHLFTAPINQALADPQSAKTFPLIDLEAEDAESFGVSTVEEFTQKQLLDLDSCTRCGRCQDNCPAYLTKKPLSPKKMTQDLKEALNERAPVIIARAKAELAKKGLGEEAATSEVEGAVTRALIGEVIEEDTIWSCTTCRACQEVCPVYVEHIPKTVELRRNLVLMESSFPQEVQLTFRNMENNGNPWGVGWASRADWAEGLDVPILGEMENPEEIEYLYWVGCAGSFDERNKKVSRALVKILKAAGIKFAILGTEEKCCGDSARRIGNEYLYQMLAQENIETMNNYKVKKIITACPHCYNTLKNDYPQLGGNYEVIHHSELIAKLLGENKIKLNSTDNRRFTYHDSCYLGRYNRVFNEPREVLRKVGVKLTEMSRNRETSFCCGAGGGRMWMEETLGERINVERTRQALATNPEGIAVNCPYCLTMLEDGIKAFDKTEEVKVYDIAELVAEKL
ncbi:heterodisulfide reductase-related iron-sulfur binding cluster [Carboxydothermus ferrireducens]|uniref:Fe-S oxidoreductase/nitrate reductase gamma subunit n=1 Tax=Carboxydothermus ferrireducens DSM 11255 TaxID=1119529 RepID=A0ABX2REB4_9THEO|nr:heterodisulfide reductase-related iron-sulfur binding cluster [Carboxydothermus ferrireducens]NYE58363.1 Fe-S oxidoreductase/nitrate reductase gamma subunit [Carboxydothermus ferrireducens DSM 11255]